MMRTVLFLAFLFSSAGSFSQALIRGQITDEAGDPLAGANVYISSLKQGDAAGVDGRFQLDNIPAGTYQLRFSFIGYQTLERKLTVQPNQPEVVLDIVLPALAVSVEELVVVATRAGSKTPMTYSNLSEETLQKNNLGQDVPYLLRWTPSAVVTSDAGTGIGYTGIRIRGTDPTRINVTINGIPLNDAESQGVFWVDLPDFASSTNSVQIQRGVGTSTNGAGAFGATINLSTFDIPQEAYGEINASAGSFNTLKGNVRFGSGLLSDHFIIEGRLSHVRSDGFIDRATADLNSFFFSTTYVGPSTSIQANLFSGHEITYQAWYGVPADSLDSPTGRTFNPAGTEKPGEPYEDEVDNYRQTHAQFLLNQQIDRHWLLNFNLHYTRGYGFFEQYKADESMAFYGLLPPGEPDMTTDLVRRRWLDNDFYGTTFALNYDGGQQGGTGTLGGAFNIYEGDHFGEVIWAQNFGIGEKDQRYYQNDARKVDFNIFGKLNYPLTEKLNAYLDLQYRRVTYEFLGFDNDGDNVAQDVALNFFNPKGGLFYAFDARSELYGSLAIANREPNRDDYVDSSPSSRPRPEHLYDTEIGYRKRWDKAALEANFYYMYYRDQLVLNGQINDVGAYTRVNVDRSYRLGLELAGGAQLAPGLEIQANATVSRNRVAAFTEYVDTYDAEFNWLGQEVVEHEQTALAFSPSVIGGGELSYDFLHRSGNQNLTLAILGKYVGKQYIDNTSDEENTIDPYFFSDLRLRYQLRQKWFKQLSLTFLLQNLFDAQYETNAWSYRYLYEGTALIDQGYYPQAGRNVLLAVSVGF